MMTKRSEQSVQFEEWLTVCMRKNSIKNYSELAKILGVTRQTLRTWMNEPRKLKRYIIAGMMHILNVENSSLSEACCMFGIV